MSFPDLVLPWRFITALPRLIEPLTLTSSGEVATSNSRGIGCGWGSGQPSPSTTTIVNEAAHLPINFVLLMLVDPFRLNHQERVIKQKD